MVSDDASGRTDVCPVSLVCLQPEDLRCPVLATTSESGWQVISPTSHWKRAWASVSWQMWNKPACHKLVLYVPRVSTMFNLKAT